MSLGRVESNIVHLIESYREGANVRNVRIVKFHQALIIEFPHKLSRPDSRWPPEIIYLPNRLNPRCWLKNFKVNFKCTESFNLTYSLHIQWVWLNYCCCLKVRNISNKIPVAKILNWYSDHEKYVLIMCHFLTSCDWLMWERTNVTNTCV